MTDAPKDRAHDSSRVPDSVLFADPMAGHYGVPKGNDQAYINAMLDKFFPKSLSEPEKEHGSDKD